MIHPYEEWSAEHSDEEDQHDVAACAEIRKVYYVEDGRNAWHSTWVRRYYANRCFDELDEAKVSVESMRVEGSTWTICESPALVYRGGLTTLAIVDVSGTALENAGPYTPTVHPIIAEIASVFASVEGVMRLIIDWPDSLDQARRFRTHRSIPGGGENGQLGWVSRESSFDLTVLREMQRIHRESLKRNTFLGVVCRAPFRRSLEFDFVIPESPLADQGVRRTDRIESIEIDGQRIDRPVQILKALRHVKPSTAVGLHFVRGKRPYRLDHTARSFADVLASRRP